MSGTGRCSNEVCMVARRTDVLLSIRTKPRCPSVSDTRDHERAVRVRIGNINS